jgi:REP element-mobilizing transposase RayT
MPYPRPPYLPGHYYHFYNRGRSRLPIFLEEDNYRFVLRKIQYYLPILEVSMIAYCLLPNHYHFLVRQDGEQRAGLLPQRVFNSYSKAHNKRYWHSGTLFEGNYKVKPVADNSYLLHLCRYIHGNPVRHGLVTDPADWPYSNYIAWIERPRDTLMDADFVREYFPNPASYQEFVMDDLFAVHPPWPKTK